MGVRTFLRVQGFAGLKGFEGLGFKVQFKVIGLKGLCVGFRGLGFRVSSWVQVVPPSILPPLGSPLGCLGIIQPN